MIDYGPTIFHGTRTRLLSKQRVPISLNGATTPHHAQVNNSGSVIVNSFLGS